VCNPVKTAFLLVLLAGCANLPKNELDISAQMRAKPVRQVFIMTPYFAGTIKRSDPADFRQMLPENQQASAKAFQNDLARALGASLYVDSSWIPGPNGEAWGGKIGADLAIGRVPLGVPSTTCPVESVLLTGLVAYGTEKDQMVIHALPFLPWTKPKSIGAIRWDHVVDVQVMLVRPSDGKILFTLRHDERFNTGYEDSGMLSQASARAAAAVADAFRKATEKTGGPSGLAIGGP